MKSHKFVDSAKVYVESGKGGDGASIFRREKYVPRGGPSGGDGGRGGHVILQADRETDSLIAVHFAPHLRAPEGGRGLNKEMHGRNGEDHIFKVPIGTTIHVEETGEFVGELLENGAQLIVGKGGKGGLGNVHWQTSTHQAPTECTPGEPGESKILRLNLKIVADIGLLGFPNAGKSSLLSAISHAHPKIASYPFTTLNPIIGTIKYEHILSLTLVDVPGLIKGAHEGHGLGHTFLRHVERTKYLVYVIDMAGTDGRNPVDDYRTLRDELKLYNKELLKRPSLLVANKMDLPESAALLKEFTRRTRKKPIQISALNHEGLEPVKQAFYDFFVEQLRNSAKAQPPPRVVEPESSSGLQPR